MLFVCPGLNEGAVPESSYNFAGGDYDQLWEAGLYNLDTWSAGLCHTYNPPAASQPGIDGQLFAFLAHKR